MANQKAIFVTVTKALAYYGKSALRWAIEADSCKRQLIVFDQMTIT